MTGRAELSYEFGPFRLEARARLLTRDGEIVSLSPKIVDTLILLVKNSGCLIGREDLLSEVWGDAFVEDANLTVSISVLRKVLGAQANGRQYIETVPKRGYRFVADVKRVSSDHQEASAAAGCLLCSSAQPNGNGRAQVHGPREEQGAPMPVPVTRESTASGLELEPLGGAVPLDSKYYVVRRGDRELKSAIERAESVILVSGARQTGKTSMLARALANARANGAKVLLTDFQSVELSRLSSLEALLLALSRSIADQLDLDVLPAHIWDPDLGPIMNFVRYLRRVVLAAMTVPLVWGMDEADRLFSSGCWNDLLALFRFWHNSRSLDPEGSWHRLTLAIAYTTEACPCIGDGQQPPLNLGTRLSIDCFSIRQVEELNFRYGSPLHDQGEVARFFGLVGGHPYLVRCGLHELAARNTDLATLETCAFEHGSPLGDHLRQLLISIARHDDDLEVLRKILKDGAGPTVESLSRLRSAGVMLGASPREAHIRCRLYALYLERQLL